MADAEGGAAPALDSEGGQPEAPVDAPDDAVDPEALANALANLDPASDADADGDAAPPVEAEAPVQAATKIPSRPTTPANEPQVTMLQVLEYLNARSWWTTGRNSMLFRMLLWLSFLGIVLQRENIHTSYQVHSALASHVRGMVAHPSVSGVVMRTLEETPALCRCACRSNGGVPSGPCDAGGGQVLNFHGHISSADMAGLIGSDSLGNRSTYDVYEELGWDDIASPEEAWFWVQHGFLPSIWGRLQIAGGLVQEGPPQGRLLRWNLVVGGVRARQQRAEETEDCEVGATLRARAYAGMRCRTATWASSAWTSAVGRASYTLDVASETASETAAMAQAAAVDAGMMDNSSTVTFAPAPAAAGPSSTASDVEGSFDAFFDIERPFRYAMETAGDLARTAWLDSGTRVLELEAALINAQVGVYSLLTVKFEFLASGGVEKEVRVHTIPVHSADIDFSDLIFEILWVGCLCILLIAQFLGIGLSVVRCRPRDKCCSAFHFADWFAIILGFVVTGFWAAILSQTTIISGDIPTLPRAPLSESVDIDDYRNNWVGVLDNVVETIVLKQYYVLCLFFYASLMTIGFLKAFLGQSKLAMLQYALSSMAWDAAHYLVMFAVIFSNFVLSGHILFGSEMRQWSSLWRAASSSFKMMVGKFDFDEMFDVYPISATAWFWLFLLSTVFMLMNVLLAMAFEHFSAIRDKVGSSVSIHEEIIAAVKDALWVMGWTIDKFKDGDWKVAFAGAYCGDSKNLIGEVVDACGLGDDDDLLMHLQRRDCLALKLAIQRAEDESVEGLTHEDKFAGRPAHVGRTKYGTADKPDDRDKQDLRKCGPDIDACDRILEQAEKYIEHDRAASQKSQLQIAREFVGLLRQHRRSVEKACKQIEEESAEDAGEMESVLDRLERSVRESLANFKDLRTIGMETLAPPVRQLALTSVTTNFKQSLRNAGIADEQMPAGVELGLAGPDPFAPKTRTPALALGDAGAPPALALMPPPKGGWPEEKCRECEGVGMLRGPGGKYVCPHCKGKGVVEVRPNVNGPMALMPPEPAEEEQEPARGPDGPLMALLGP